MKKLPLGEFEEIILLTIVILHPGAFGLAIKKEIEARASRSVSIGALHTALIRLEEKGYLKSREGAPTPDRAGRPKKFYQLTGLGKSALEYVRNTRQELWTAAGKNAWNLKNT